MKKLILCLAMAFIGTMSFAGEGMWLLQYIAKLNYADMKVHGFKLTAEQIYDVNHSSIKDAIVQLGGFCTGEMISDQGLMLTNHHCGFDAIQSNSTVEHDYLTNGFWAMTKGQEIPIQGLFVKYLVRMESVTDKVLDGVMDETNSSERAAIINENINKIQEDNSVDGLEAEVETFFEGSEFYMFIYKTYTDIRLVGAPPSAVGKFGGDTDNWMWPRHTGDFSMFRVYSGKDGKPAEYSENNIPYKPKHHLPISLKGVTEGDFAMIMGYPGSTDRFLSSYGVQEAVDVEQPTRVKIRGAVLDIMKEYMNASDSIRIKYASKYAQIANYWKYFIGQSSQLVKNKVFDKKLKIENDFQKWADSSPENQKKYGNVITNIAEAYKAKAIYTIPNAYFQEAVFNMQTNMLILSAGPFRNLAIFGSDFNATDIQNQKDDIATAVDAFYKDYYAPIDKELYAKLLAMYFNDVSKDFHPVVLDEIYKKYKGDFTKFVNKTWNKSIFTSKERLMAFVDKPDEKVFKADFYFRLLKGFISTYRNNVAIPEQMSTSKLNNAKRLFEEGLRKMHPDVTYYPDANFTMRLTYGNVMPYIPKDGVTYNYYTTVDGILQKEDPNNPEFVVPKKLKKLILAKDFGQYGQDGNLRVCFISNLDITGGNSGSPVIDGDGNLIGVAFDGNWEAMSGDIAFEPDLQRTISVDIRYILFIIDKYAGAHNLIEEMDLVTADTKVEPEQPAGSPQ